MKKIIGFTIFFAVFLAVYGGMNYYVYINLVQALPMSPGLRLMIQVSFIILALAYPAAQFLKPRLRLPFLTYSGALWMGVLSISIAVFAAQDMLSLLLPVRYQVLAVGAVIILTVWAAAKAWRGPGIKTVRIQHKKMAGPISIIHLSDLHLGTMTSAKWLDRVVNQVNSLGADIIVITGDLVEDSFAAVEQFVPVFRSLEAKYGIYAVSGNHEYYQGIEHFRAFCQSAGIEVADGKFFAVTQGVNLVGLDGNVTRVTSGFADGIRGLLTDSDSDDYNILLIHHPVGFEQTAKAGIDLQLSGHTHKGQILPFNFFVRLVYRYAYGLHALGESHIYTSSGTGTWGPPLRLGSSSEIVMIEVI